MTTPHSPFRVDLDALLDTVQHLTTFEGECDDALDLVSRRVAGLHETWSGLTAQAQQAAQAAWEHGFAQMRDGLVDMREAARTAHGNYTAAVEANIAMWGSL